MSNKGISFLPFISLCNGLYEYLDQFKWIAKGQDIWFEFTYKIDLDEYKTPFGFYGEYCNETRRNSALKCKPDIYDENDYYLSHNLLNPATKRQVIHEDEMWSDEVQN